MDSGERFDARSNPSVLFGGIETHAAKRALAAAEVVSALTALGLFMIAAA